jgi:hypothetical protein
VYLLKNKKDAAFVIIVHLYFFDFCIFYNEIKICCFGASFNLYLYHNQLRFRIRLFIIIILDLLRDFALFFKNLGHFCNLLMLFWEEKCNEINQVFR